MQFDTKETGTGKATLEQFDVLIEGRVHEDGIPEIHQGSEVQIGLKFTLHTGLKPVQLQLSVNDEAQSQVVTYPIVNEAGEMLDFAAGQHDVTVALGSLDLNAGNYNFMLAVREKQSKINHLRKSGIAPFLVVADCVAWAPIVRPVTVGFCDEKIK